MRMSEVFGDLSVLANTHSRLGIGGNNPPNTIETSRDVFNSLATFLKETPVITSEVEAKKGANFLEQIRRTLGEMEDERKGLVRPLNEQVSEINDTYRKPRESLESVLNELRSRLTAFARAEEERRQREAEHARRAAEEAERLAREAEQREREAKEDASTGVESDVSTAIVEADTAFDAFKRADRTAARAERSVPVRLSGGYGRAVSMRTKETLVIHDIAKAIRAIGITEKIRDAVLSSARDYRKLKGELPKGISASTEREI